MGSCTTVPNWRARGSAEQRFLGISDVVLSTFTENMMAYALGRRVEYYDMPTIREITRAAEVDDYSMSSFILGVVNSPPFRMARAGTVAEDQAPDGTTRPNP